MRRTFATILMASAGLMAILLWTGCGQGTMAEQQLLNASSAATVNVGDTLDKRIDEFKKMEMTIEVIQDGTSTGKWSQKNGSWRWDDLGSNNFYVIYNNEQRKTWMVKDNQATDTSGSPESYASFNPSEILSAYASIPCIGGFSDTWEFDSPDTGKLMTIEMSGPQGLPSKIVDENPRDEEVRTIEFVYTNVDSVPDSTFELPPDVPLIR